MYIFCIVFVCQCGGGLFISYYAHKKLPDPLSFFGIGRFITNQQNIYTVTPVHYLQKAEKKT